ncbi:MAG: two-partner secretion domain-containing protein, partial [Roseateles sp.]|uniref:two-partner secretion domain-containing protein n=1 Tax=Roseateles sp. TaxID=1971397 RepID=UPI0040353CCA
MVAFLQAFHPAAHAAPQGAQVVQGQVAINPGLIQQASDKAIVNWQSFSIAAGETLRVQQPGVNSVLLNRVVGGDPSLILGQLRANGRVFLVNPRGIVFGRGSQVNVGGLVASTLDLSDTNLLAGDYRFSAGAQAGTLQADGSITAPGGTVALLAPQLDVGGSIQARRVGLAAASTVQVDVEGDGLVLFNLRNDDVRGDRETALKFSGRVQADGGSAELRAQARAGAAGQVLNMDGLIQARGLTQQGGRIVIDGGTVGDTLVNGRLDATGINANKGGNITVLGQRVALLDAARLDVSGVNGGGSLQVGGGFLGRGTDYNAERTVVAAGAQLLADATGQGDGGRIAVWADGRTDMLGHISARGGRLGGDGGKVETSGLQQLNLPSGSVDVSAPRGRAGQWLLDPNDLSIVAGNGTVNVSSAMPFVTTDDSATLGVDVLNAALAGGANVTVQTTNSGAAPAQAGNITVAANIVGAGPATLNLVAIGSINFSAASISAGAGALDVNLQAGGGITGSSISTSGGSISATGTGSIDLGSVTAAGLSITSNGGAVVLPSGSLTGTLGVTSGGGAITQGGALTVGGSATLAAGGGSVTLGTFNSGNLGITTTSAAVQLGVGTVTGTLSANSGGGAITQAGALTVTGDATLTAGAGMVTLDSLSSGNLDITTSNAAIQLGAGTVTGSLTATSAGGAVTQAGALVVTGAAAITAGAGDITLTAANNLQGAVDLSGATTQISNGGAHALTLGTLNTGALTATTGGGALDLGAGTVGGALTASSSGGAITQGGALSVT